MPTSSPSTHSPRCRRSAPPWRASSCLSCRRPPVARATGYDPSSIKRRLASAETPRVWSRRHGRVEGRDARVWWRTDTGRRRRALPARGADERGWRVIFVARHATPPVAGHEQHSTLHGDAVREIAVGNPDVLRALDTRGRGLGQRSGHRALELLHGAYAQPTASAKLRDEKKRDDHPVMSSDPSQHDTLP